MTTLIAVSDAAKQSLKETIEANAAIDVRRKELVADLAKMGAFKVATAGADLAVCAAAFAGRPPANWEQVDGRLLGNPTMPFYRPKQGSEWDARFAACNRVLPQIEGVKNFEMTNTDDGLKVRVSSVVARGKHLFLNTAADVETVPGFDVIAKPAVQKVAAPQPSPY